MANTGSLGKMCYVEHFITDNIGTTGADGIAWVVSSDSGDTAFARAAAAGRGLHAAGATAATNSNLIELCGDTTFIYGQQGYNMMEVLFMIDDVTNVAFNIGFNDDSLETSNTLPAELSTTTFTANAADFIGLVYDTDATNDEVHCFWVDDSSVATETIANLRMTGAAPQASKWMMARVALQDRGANNGVRATFTFGVDGKSFEKEFNTSLDRDVALVPYLGFENRSASAHNVYVRYIKLEQSISD